MARILDNPKALNQQPAATKATTATLDDLRKSSARHKGRLASVQGPWLGGQYRYRHLVLKDSLASRAVCYDSGLKVRLHDPSVLDT